MAESEEYSQLLVSQRSTLDSLIIGIIPKNGEDSAQSCPHSSTKTDDKTRLVMAGLGLILPKTDDKTRLVIACFGHKDGR